MAKPNDTTPARDPSRWADEWVTKLAADPNKTPDAVVVTGFIAGSPDRKSVRVFLNAELQNWVDVPVDAVLHREAIPKTVSPLGGSYLWVNKATWSTCQMGQTEHKAQEQQT